MEAEVVATAPEPTDASGTKLVENAGSPVTLDGLDGPVSAPARLLSTGD
jgi:hypothetical protein